MHHFSCLTPAGCPHGADQSETGQEAAAEAAVAAGLLRPIRQSVSIADMAAGLSAVTGGVFTVLEPTENSQKPASHQCSIKGSLDAAS